VNSKSQSLMVRPHERGTLNGIAAIGSMENPRIREGYPEQKGLGSPSNRREKIRASDVLSHGMLM